MRRVVIGAVLAVVTFLVGVAAVMLVGVWAFEPVGETTFSDAVTVPAVEEPQTLEYWVVPSPSHCGEEVDLAVYRAILSGTRYSGRKIVIDDMSSRGDTMMDQMVETEQVKGASGEAIRDYKRRNAEPESLRYIGAISPRIEFVSAEDIERIFPANSAVDPWTNFYKRYPGSGGLVSLSVPGFNEDHTEALVYVAHMCGGLCGGGEFVILKKDRGRWVVDRTDELWVS